MHDFVERLGIQDINDGAATTSGFLSTTGRVVDSFDPATPAAWTEVRGQVTEVIAPGEGYGDLHEPFGLPGGRGILFVSHPSDRGPSVLELWRDGERRVLFEARSGDRLWYPCYDPEGYVLFRWTRGEATEGLWAIFVINQLVAIKVDDLIATVFDLHPLVALLRPSGISNRWLSCNRLYSGRFLMSRLWY